MGLLRLASQAFLSKGRSRSVGASSRTLSAPVSPSASITFRDSRRSARSVLLRSRFPESRFTLNRVLLGLVAELLPSD